MDEELKKALADLGVNTVAEAGKKAEAAVASLRQEFEANEKKRDAVNDEKLARINAELDKVEKVNTLVNQIEAKAAADKEELQNRLDEMEARLNRPETGGTEADAQAREYRDAFFAHARRGDQAFNGDRKNVLQVGDDTSAGYLAPAEFVAEILKAIVEESPMRGLVTVRRTGKRGVILPKRTGRPKAKWVGEIEKREDSEDLSYGVDDIPVHETTVLVPISNAMLEDADFNMEDEIREAVAEAYGEQEGAAILVGTNNKQPEGLLTGTGFIEVNSGHASTFDGDSFIKLRGGIKTGYARNGSFILNRKSLTAARLLKASDGHYIWQSGLAAGRPNTIDGDPYAEMPDMPDIASGAYPVGYGDWKKAYTLVDRLDMQVLRDPFTRAGVGQVLFHWRKRLGGAVRLREAYALMKVAA